MCGPNRMFKKLKAKNTKRLKNKIMRYHLNMI